MMNVIMDTLKAAPSDSERLHLINSLPAPPAIRVIMGLTTLSPEADAFKKLKPLAKDAYKAAMAAREGKDAAAAQKVVRALFEHIPRDAILDAYAGATRKFQLPN